MPYGGGGRALDELTRVHSGHSRSRVPSDFTAENIGGGGFSSEPGVYGTSFAPALLLPTLIFTTLAICPPPAPARSRQPQDEASAQRRVSRTTTRRNRTARRPHDA
eukprot:1195713-Prorocentrum_minimum.AAC.2